MAEAGAFIAPAATPSSRPTVSAGAGHSCAVAQNRTVYCWGWNEVGQLGNGTTVPSASPVLVPSLTGVRAVGTGVRHTCALLLDGTVQCWGDNTARQLGEGVGGSESLVPVAVVGISGATGLATKGAGACVLVDSKVVCWGSHAGIHTLVWDDGTDVTNVTSLASSASDSQCGVRSSGTVFCWGSGVPPLGGTYEVPGLSNVVAVDNSHDLRCAVLGNGTVKCWGRDPLDPMRTWQWPTAAVDGITDAVSVAVGFAHYCVLKLDTTVVCWGRNGSGQLGDGTLVDRAAPAPVPGLTGVVALSATTEHTCALLSTQAVRCWGLNDTGQAGSGGTVHSPSSIGPGVSVSAGGAHACAVRADTTVACWGDNMSLQLGTTATVAPPGSPARSALPITVVGLTGVKAVAAGSQHTCALMANRTVKCWGARAVGQTGQISPLPSAVPSAVSGISTAIAIASGGTDYTCALLADRTVKCWGSNSLGQFLPGGPAAVATPTTVAGVTAVRSLSTSTPKCAVRTDATAVCWGYNYFDPAAPTSVAAVTVPGLAGATRVTGSGYEGCARLVDGSSRCWGPDNYGVHGTGTISPSRTASVVPTVVPAGSEVTVSASGVSACGRTPLRRIACWGTNDRGQLGTGWADSPPSLDAYLLPTVKGATAFSVGSSLACAIVPGPTVTCWGWESALNTSSQPGVAARMPFVRLPG